MHRLKNQAKQSIFTKYQVNYIQSGGKFVSPGIQSRWEKTHTPHLLLNPFAAQAPLLYSDTLHANWLHSSAHTHTQASRKTQEQVLGNLFTDRWNNYNCGFSY